MNVLPYGSDAVLVEPGAALSPSGLWRGLEAVAHPAVAEAVPAAITVLVRFQRSAPRPDVPELLAAAAAAAGDDTGDSRPELRLPVRYDGPDLADLAAELGRSAESVAAEHSGARYVVAFCGFAPGFGYLTGLPPTLHAPRLAEPRTAVPAGAVGIAGEYTGVYPRPSPGGWRLIGRTDATLWDLAADPPAAFTPGRAVRFDVVR